MIFLRSLIFNVSFYVWTFLIVLLALPGLILPQLYTMYVAYYWGLGTHFLLRYLIGIHYEIKGKEYWDGGPVIFASKHQSFLETTMIHVLAFKSAIILKRELTWIPLFGQCAMRAGVIAINRAKSRGIIDQLVKGARKFIACGRPVFIFPEGTRTAYSTPTKLRYGIAALYKACNVPVIPLVLNTGLYCGRRQFIKKPGKIIYEFLPPILPGMPEAEFLKHLEYVIEDGCQRLKMK